MCIPGVAQFSWKFSKHEFTDVHDIFEKTLAVHAEKTIENKSFCVRVKRSW